jgi:predicted HicB family RNase H-like nuclease
MGVPLKTENEECAGKTLRVRDSEGGRRCFTGTCQLGITWRVPRDLALKAAESGVSLNRLASAKLSQ